MRIELQADNDKPSASANERPSPALNAIFGALWATLPTFLIAPAVAWFFRFPVPFAGYVSGLKAIPLVAWAVLFYGVGCGGFILLGGLGALGGGLVGIGLPDDETEKKTRFVRIFGISVAAAGTLWLSVLDYIRGEW